MELFGREEEERVLASALKRGAAGAGGVVLVGGEAGVGKTALVREIVDVSGMHEFRGEGHDLATAPFGPLIDAIRGVRLTSPAAFARCRGVFPVLSSILPELAQRPKVADRNSLFHAIGSIFETIAVETPCVLVLDDLHWADHATLEWIDVFAARFARQPIVLLATYRSDELPRAHPLRRLRQSLRRNKLLTEIALPPLDAANTARVVSGILGGLPSDALADEIHRLSDGLPLYVEELARALLAQGRLRSSAKGYELSQRKDLPIPEGLRDAVLIRIDTLDSMERAVLDRAAVAGSSFDLRCVAGQADDVAALDHLIEAGLIVESGEDSARFHHTLVRDVVYDEIPWTRRRNLHREVALALERYHGPPERVAEHWVAARDTEKSRVALLALAARAAEIHAHHDAVRHYSRALESWPDNQDEAGRLQVLSCLGESAQLANLHAEATLAYNEIAECARKLSDDPLLARVSRKLAGLWSQRADWSRALAARAEAAQAYAKANLPGEAAAERMAGSNLLSLATRHSEAMAWLDAALEEADTSGFTELQLRIRAAQGCVLARLGRTSEGVERARTALNEALERNLMRAAHEAYRHLADALENAGDYAGSRQVFLTAIHVCGADGDTAMRSVCKGCALPIFVQSGDWDAGIALAEELLNDSETRAVPHQMALSFAGWMQLLRGETKTGRARIGASLVEAQKIGLLQGEVFAHYALAMADLLDQDVTKAAAHCHQLLALSAAGEERHHIVPLLRGAASCFGTAGDVEGLRACAGAIAKTVSATGQHESLSAMAHVLGESAWLAGRLDEAAREFESSIDLLKDLPLAPAQADTRVRLAEVLALNGEKDRAATLLQQALETYRMLKAAPLIARTMAQLQQLVPSALSVADKRLMRSGLTERQLQILCEVAHGQTDKQIARKLGLSPRTVEMHVARALTTLQCSNRAEAVRKAGETGLLS